MLISVEIRMFTIYDLYGHTLAQESMPRGIMKFIIYNFSLFIIIIYYIPTNFISFDTVDFTSVIRCSGSPHCGSPLYEIDDLVHNVFLKTECMRNCDVIHIEQFKICTKSIF